MTNTNSHEARFKGFMESLEEEAKIGTDRGVVLTCASLLEATLEDLLGAFLIDHSMTHDLLRSPGKPLNGFANRVDMAFVLGLITPADRLTLDIVRDIGCDAAYSIHFEIGRSEHATRIRDAYGRSDIKQGEVVDREKFFHVIIHCLSNLHLAMKSIGDHRTTIRKTYQPG